MGKRINTRHLAGLPLQRHVMDVYSIVGDNTAQWYTVASETLYEDCDNFGLDYRTICAVTAVLSPQLRWDKNLLTMRQIVSDYQNDGLTSGYVAYSKNVHKAARILSGEHPDSVIGGLKVIAFYNNLLHPTVNTGYVTIDRHAINIALNGIDAEKRKSGDYTATSKAHGMIAQAYITAAHEVGVLPQQLQAATWSYCASENSY